MNRVSHESIVIFSVLYNAVFPETVAELPGGFGLVHAIRLGIEPFAELGGQLVVMERVRS